MHVTIDAAKEGEIGGERWDVEVEGVADFDGDDIIAANFQGIGGVEDERGKSAAMSAEVVAIDPDFGGAEGAVEFQKQAAAGVVVVYPELLAIPTGAAIVIGAAVLAI